MGLNHISAFLDDEKINYFSMLCSAKHFLKLGSLVSISSFLFGVSPARQSRSWTDSVDIKEH